MRDRLNACNAAVGQASTDEACKREIPDLEARIQAASSTLANCGAVPATVERAYYDATVQAAKLGDVDAQICYLRGNFKIDFPQQNLEQYKDVAMAYAQAGLARGDWRAVKLLGTTDNYLAHAGGLMSALPIGDPYTVYRMNRLLRLGAVGDYAELLDMLAKDSSAKLSEEEKVKAFAWARQEYGEHFSRAPQLASEPESCQDTEPPAR